MRRLAQLFLAGTVLLTALPALAELTWTTQAASLNAEVGATSISATYDFTNSGEKPLTIVDLSTGCDCTTAKLEKRVYAPKESGTINVTFNIGDRVGEQHKTILVKTDDPRNPIVLLTLNVTIPKLWSVAPRYLYWKIGETPESRQVKITTEGDKPHKLQGVEVLEGDVKAELREEESGRRYEVVITPNDPKRPTRARIRVVPEDPKLQVPLLYAAVLAETSPRDASPATTQPAK